MVCSRVDLSKHFLERFLFILFFSGLLAGYVGANGLIPARAPLLDRQQQTDHQLLGEQSSVYLPVLLLLMLELYTS